MVTEAAGKAPEPFQFFGVGFVVDAVNEGFCVLRRHPVHLSCSSYEFGHGAVGEQHELLYQPVGFLAYFFVNVYRTSVFVHLHLHFGPVEINGSHLEAFGLQFRSQAVKCQDGLFQFAGRGFSAFDYALGLVVIQTEIGIDGRAAYPAVLYFCLGAYFADHRVG